MADGDSTAGGMGMGMIIGLLLVLILVIGGGVYFFSGHGAATNPASTVAVTVPHTVSGTATVQ